MKSEAFTVESGTTAELGSGGDHDWWEWIVGWLEFLSVAGTERAVVDAGLFNAMGPDTRSVDFRPNFRTDHESLTQLTFAFCP